MTTFPPVPLTLTPEAAHRVHELALASAGRASLAYAARLVWTRDPEYRSRIDRMPCGDQDAESDRTEWIRIDAAFAWELADSVRAGILAAYPCANMGGVYGQRIREAADQCRELVTLVESIPTDRAELLSALRDTVTRCGDALQTASDDMYL
jgi:hypothetical protein